MKPTPQQKNALNRFAKWFAHESILSEDISECLFNRYALKFHKVDFFEGDIYLKVNDDFSVSFYLCELRGKKYLFTI